jgi:hypothetical protein
LPCTGNTHIKIWSQSELLCMLRCGTHPHACMHAIELVHEDAEHETNMQHVALFVCLFVYSEDIPWARSPPPRPSTPPPLAPHFPPQRRGDWARRHFGNVVHTERELVKKLARCCPIVVALEIETSGAFRGPREGPHTCAKTRHMEAPAPAAPRRGARWGLHVLFFDMCEAPPEGPRRPDLKRKHY